MTHQREPGEVAAGERGALTVTLIGFRWCVKWAGGGILILTDAIALPSP